jgi:hypothetical protein
MKVVRRGCKTLNSHFEGRTQIRGYENKGQRKMFAAKIDNVRGKWTKLRNKKLHSLYTSVVLLGYLIKQDEERPCG